MVIFDSKRNFKLPLKNFFEKLEKLDKSDMLNSHQKGIIFYKEEYLLLLKINKTLPVHIYELPFFLPIKNFVCMDLSFIKKRAYKCNKIEFDKTIAVAVLLGDKYFTPIIENEDFFIKINDIKIETYNLSNLYEILFLEFLEFTIQSNYTKADIFEIYNTRINSFKKHVLNLKLQYNIKKKSSHKVLATILDMNYKEEGYFDLLLDNYFYFKEDKGILKLIEKHLSIYQYE